MRNLRIALLNASGDENTPRNFRRELDADLVEFDVHETTPDDFEFDAAVVTGSRSSVYWDEPWIEPLREWVRTAVDRGIAVLGVCFGHQILADALGGTVEDMGEYEIGYRTVDPKAGNTLLGDEPLTVFTTHSDTVTELPPGATQTAENDYGVHGFRVENAFGVQFHPEYDMETARTVAGGKDLPGDRIERVLDDITETNYTKAREAKSLFGRFTRFVRNHSNASTGRRATPAESD